MGTRDPLRALVQWTLDEHPSTAGSGISVVDRDGRLELQGTVDDAEQRASASEIARAVPGVGTVRNMLGIRATTGQQSAAPVSGVGYGAAWLQAFLHQGSGLRFDEGQAAQVAALAERKLVDLFDVAETTALANGRAQILFHDVPITKGLRQQIDEAAALAGSVELRPLLVFLADAGVPGPLDEHVRHAIPKMMAALLLLAARVIAILEPSDMSTEERLERLLRHVPTGPTHWELDRATRVVNLAL